MPALLERCGDLRRELLGFEPALLSGEDCRTLAEELARTEKACAAARARAATRAADCGSFRNAGFADAAEWLARSSGSSRGAAAAELHTVAAAENCPRTKDALAAGLVSLAQAGEIARTEAECPGSETELLALAQRAGLGPVKDEARKKRLAAISPEALAARQHAVRCFRHWKDDLGMVRFSGALEPLAGVPLMNRLDAETDRIRRAARRSGVDEAREAHAADAFMTAEGGRGKAWRADLVIVCDLLAYRRGHTEGNEACHIVGGGPVPVAVARDMVDDAFVKAVTHDGVRIDTVVHFGRHIPAELRTALELGDPPGFDGVVCSEVGCERRFGLEWDHVNPVANNGPTSFENLQGRC